MTTSPANAPKFGDWNARNQKYTATSDKVNPNDPSFCSSSSSESPSVEDGGGGQIMVSKQTKASNTKKPAQAVASGRIYNQRDHDYKENNRGNAINDQASSEQQMQQRGFNNNIINIYKGQNNNNNNNNGVRRTPSQYQGRLGNRPAPSLARKLHGDVQGNHANSPKFGEWNVKQLKDYSAIFNKLQQEKKAGLSARVSPAARKASEGLITKDHPKNVPTKNSRNQKYTRSSGKVRADKSMKKVQNPNDPSFYSASESPDVEDGGGGQILEDSQKKSMQKKATNAEKPAQAAIAFTTTHNQRDHTDSKVSFPKNNKSNIINDQASSEKQMPGGSIKNSNNNNSYDNEHDYSSSTCISKPSVEESLKNIIIINNKGNNNNNNNNNNSNDNNGGKRTPSQYQGRLGNRLDAVASSLAGNLHGDVGPQQLRRSATGPNYKLEGNHATSPKFGEWNLKKLKDYSVIFNRLQQEKKAGLSARVSPAVFAPASEGLITSVHEKPAFSVFFTD